MLILNFVCEAAANEMLLHFNAPRLTAGPMTSRRTTEEWVARGVGSGGGVLLGPTPAPARVDLCTILTFYFLAQNYLLLPLSTQLGLPLLLPNLPLPLAKHSPWPFLPCSPPWNIFALSGNF